MNHQLLQRILVGLSEPLVGFVLRDGRFQVPGFGVFKLRRRKALAAAGIRPAVPAHLAITFTPSSKLRARLKVAP